MQERKKWVCECVSLTGAHHDLPVLGCTGLPAGPAAHRLLQTPAGCPMSVPDRSVSSTEEGEAAARRNADAPPGGPQAGTPDDPAPQESGRKIVSVQNFSVSSVMQQP